MIKILTGFRIELICLVLVGVILGAFHILAGKVENLTAERDQAQAARVVAERSLQDHRRISAATIKALETARERDEERNDFVTENRLQIERDRKTGDGPSAPVLRNTAIRLRDRLNARAGSLRDP